MKFKANSGIVIYLKLFTTGVVLFIAIKVIIMAGSVIFNRSLSTGFGSLSLSGIALASAIIALLTLTNYLHTTKAIRMDDKALFAEMIARALYKMKWKIKSQEEAEIIFVSAFQFPAWKERIIIRFTDTELQISGPRESIERAIRLTNFPNDAFEISKFSN